MAETMPDPVQPELLGPEELRKISEDGELAELRRALDEARKAEAAQQTLHLALMSAAPNAFVLEQVMILARLAATHGQREILLFDFSSRDCTDGGHCIWTSDPRWPDTLRGAALRTYALYVEHLKVRGFDAHPRVIGSAGQRRSDIGLFLSW